MKLYFAGNFPQMKDIEEERKFRDFLEQKEYEYLRLVSFFYEDCIIPIQVENERIENEL